MSRCPNPDWKQFNVVLYDGQCMLCHWCTRFLIRFDRNQHFKLASVQSPIGQEILKAFNFPTETFDTIVLVEHGGGALLSKLVGGSAADASVVSTESTAVLRIASQLGFPWSVVGYAGLWVPPSIRDWCYRFVARNRYYIFGKFDEQCLLPCAKHDNHFLERCVSKPK